METIETTATVLFIVAAASIFGWLLTATRVTDMVTAWVLGFTHSPWVFLLLVNLLLLFVGCFLEPTAAILIAIPVLMPAVTQLGIDPVHFGLIVVLNLMIGLLHPPMGMVLYRARASGANVARAHDDGDPAMARAAARQPDPDHLRPDHLAVAAHDCSTAERGAVATIRTRRNPAGRPAAEGRAHRRDPVVRHAGDADRAHHAAATARRGSATRYTIGTGGSSVGRAAARPSCAAADRPRSRLQSKAIWKDLFFHTHATAVGAITSLALAAIDTALWDLQLPRARTSRCGRRPAARRPQVPVYTTEGGWLHHCRRSRSSTRRWPRRRRVSAAPSSRSASRRSPRTSRGSRAVRDGGRRRIRAHGRREPGIHGVRGAAPRARVTSRSALAWFEEPLPAEDLAGHVELAAQASMPIAVGESLYHPSHFREYLERDACSIVQVDCARIGGITPWLKVAHLAGDFQRRGVPAFPDGAARVAGGRGAERRVGRVHPAARRASRRRG